MNKRTAIMVFVVLFSSGTFFNSYAETKKMPRVKDPEAFARVLKAANAVARAQGKGVIPNMKKLFPGKKTSEEADKENVSAQSKDKKEGQNKSTQDSRR